MAIVINTELYSTQSALSYLDVLQIESSRETVEGIALQWPATEQP